MGWAAVIALMQQIWLPNDVSTESQAADWLFMLGDNLGTAAGLMLCLDSHPSVCLGSLSSTRSLEDFDGLGAAALRSAEQLPALQWEKLMDALLNGNQLFPKEAVEDHEPDDEDQASLAARAHAHGPDPPMEKAKVARKKPTTDTPRTPKTPPKPRAPKTTKNPKPAAEPVSQSSCTPPTPSTPAKVSSLKNRLAVASGLKKPK